MADNTLTPATELAARNKAHFPNETADYRKIRNALLAEEIDLRRNIERVAELRRKLPLGGKIPEDYAFQSENGPVRLSDLFGGKQTLAVYSMMFGPQRASACPMCTAMLTSWDGTARNVPRASRPSLSPPAPPSNAFSTTRGNAIGATCNSTPTPAATTRAPMSALTTATSPA